MVFIWNSSTARNASLWTDRSTTPSLQEAEQCQENITDDHLRETGYRDCVPNAESRPVGLSSMYNTICGEMGGFCLKYWPAASTLEIASSSEHEPN